MNYLYQKKIRKQWHEAKSIESSSLAVVQEALSSLKIVQAFSREELEKYRFESRGQVSVSRMLKLMRDRGLMDFFVGMSLALGMTLAVYIGAQDVNVSGVAGHTFSLGNFIMVLAYLTLLYDIASNLTMKIGDMQASWASAERSLELLQEKSQILEVDRPLSINISKGKIEFRNLCFSYKNNNTIIKNFNLLIQSGERVGIVGESGSGKSTLLLLLLRFYDPTSGQILLDDEDIRNYKIKDLRKQYSIVQQEPYLFARSIYENIAYGSPEAEFTDVKNAARMAQISDAIEKLPHGYDTLLADLGSNLSGGQRQRISIARACIRNSPILILDEPTSALDDETEKQLLDSLEILMKGKTTFIVSHKPNILKLCDRVIEFGK
jgi:ATP-binding cassette subfamily B protein